MKGEDGLTKLQHRALPHLLDSRSIEEGAQRAGVSAKQVYEWLKQPRFKSELEALRAQILESAIDRLRKGAVRSAEVIIELLESQTESMRLKAADLLLANFMKLTEVVKFEDRLTALEARTGKV